MWRWERKLFVWLILLGVLLILEFFSREPLLLILVIGLIFICAYGKKAKLSKMEEYKEQPEILFEPIYAMEVIRNRLPEFDREIFLTEISQKYIDIQEAKTFKDYNSLEKFTDNNLYETWKLETQQMINRNEKHIISEPKINFIGISDAYIEENNLIIKVKVNLSKKDYIINSITQDIMEGENNIQNFSYNLSFKYIDNSWILISEEYIKSEKDLNIR